MKYFKIGLPWPPGLEGFSGVEAASSNSGWAGVPHQQRCTGGRMGAARRRPCQVQVAVTVIIPLPRPIAIHRDTGLAGDFARRVPQGGEGGCVCQLSLGGALALEKPEKQSQARWAGLGET